MRSFVRLHVRSIKNGHLIGRRNDVTANMAALAVCMWLAASRPLDTPRSSVWVSQARRALAQKFNKVRGNCSGYWYVGIFVSLFGYFSCQRSGLLKARSLSRSKLLGRKLAWLGHCLIG